MTPYPLLDVIIFIFLILPVTFIVAVYIHLRWEIIRMVPRVVWIMIKLYFRKLFNIKPPDNG